MIVKKYGILCGVAGLIFVSNALLLVLSASESKLPNNFVFRKAPVPSLDTLRKQFGEGGGLSHKQSRLLYHVITEWAQKTWPADALNAGATMHDLAVGCTLLRWRTKLYVRERGPLLTKYALGFRDAFKHAGSRFSLRAFGDIAPCLLQHEDFGCPSYASLGTRKDDAAIVASCWKTNAAYDERYGINQDESGSL